MLSLLLNIGHDIGAILVDTIAYVNKWRASSRVLKVLLWPVAWGLTFLKVMTFYIANGCRQFYNVSWPWGVTGTRNHFYSATPASIYCFDKKMFFVFLLEIYFFFFYCRYILDRTKYILPYLPIKLLVTLVPFLALTPTQRLSFWVLATLLTLAEICLGLFLILSMGFGIDFKQGHFYLKWKKHYHYRAPTSNRIIFFEVATHTYVLIKLFTLNDVWCSWRGRWKPPLKGPSKKRAGLISDRLQNPHKPTKGDLGLFHNLETSDVANYMFALAGFLIIVCLFGLVFLVRRIALRPHALFILLARNVSLRVGPAGSAAPDPGRPTATPVPRRQLTAEDLIRYAPKRPDSPV